ncbi:hypothetical protein D3C87_1550250 [compost metagenome]
MFDAGLPVGVEIIGKPVGAQNDVRRAGSDDLQFHLAIGNGIVGIDAEDAEEHDLHIAAGSFLDNRRQRVDCIQTPASQDQKQTIDAIEGIRVGRGIGIIEAHPFRAFGCLAGARGRFHAFAPGQKRLYQRRADSAGGTDYEYLASHLKSP